MGRRPTIQTTVTASLTKSSLGACNQMLPVKCASKFLVCFQFKNDKEAISQNEVPFESLSLHSS